MPTYLHPGVYVEEIPSGSKPIEGVATSVAAFVGYTTKGPLGDPTRITKWDAYVKDFGGIRNTAKETAANKIDVMGHAVNMFFQNGGTTAYIVRITKDWHASSRDAARAIGFADHPDVANSESALKFTAINEGAWGNGIIAKVTVSALDSSLYNVAIGRNDAEGDFEVIELFTNLSMDETNPQYIEGVINGVSELVTVDVVPVGSMGMIPAQYYLGVLIGGVVAQADLDLSTASEAERTLSLDLDTGGDNEVLNLALVLDATDYSVPEDFPTLEDALEALAADIQTKARAGADLLPSQSGLTCEVVDGDKLKLTSGTREEKSAVKAKTGGMGTTLKLRPSDATLSSTGKESAEAAWNATTSAPGTPDATLAGGLNGTLPDTDDYQAVFDAFVKYRDINIILLPGQYWADDGSGNAVISAAIAHAEQMKSRMVLVEPPPGQEMTTEKQVSDFKLPTSTYTVLYYPWIKVANPFYNAETAPGLPKTLLVPPGPIAAGMWSKIDGRRGVWKAPAGVETGLLGVAGLQYIVEDGEQDVLNPLGVNCLRALPNFGSVIWGSRTLSTKANPEWRYVPVRRTAIMMEQSIYNGIQWAVFEPNNHLLWAALRANIGSFMDGLFRSGAFQGEKASDAYFVRCGLDDTMTQGDIDRGQVIVIVGFAPLKPAEFVIVRIQQKVGKQ